MNYLFEYDIDVRLKNKNLFFLLKFHSVYAITRSKKATAAQVVNYNYIVLVVKQRFNCCHGF
jgi:hypothetical protein